MFCRSGPVRTLDKDGLGRSGQIIVDNTVWRFSILVYTTVGRLFGKAIPITNFPKIFRRSVLLSVQYLAISSYFVFWISAFTRSWVLLVTFVFRRVCSSKSLWHCVSLPRSTPVVRNEVLRNVLRCLHNIFRWCVAAPGHDVSNVNTFLRLTLNAMDCVFACRISVFFCGSLSSAYVEFVILLVNWFALCDYELSLCKLLRWRQCSLSIGKVSGILSLRVVIVVGDTSITLNGTVLGESVCCTTQSAEAHWQMSSLVARRCICTIPRKTTARHRECFDYDCLRIVSVMILFP